MDLVTLKTRVKKIFASAQAAAEEQEPAARAANATNAHADAIAARTEKKSPATAAGQQPKIIPNLP